MIYLKTRTEYSFGKTYAKLPRVIERLKELGCKSAGIVDHSSWGHTEWFSACKEAGIQPLIGLSIPVTDEPDKTPSMWFLAKNKDGLSELYRAASKSYKQKIETKFGHTNRLTKDDVLLMSNNIIKFAGDIVDGEFLKACRAYIDLSPSSRVINAAKKAIAEKHGLEIVEVGDNYFSSEDEEDVFKIMIKGGSKPTKQYIDYIEPSESLIKIAKECEGLELPIAPMIHAKGDLEALCREGIKNRGMDWNDEYEKRLKYELDLIESKDFTSYFIVVADMVRYAKQHMLVGPSRGSAAGSLVCYLSHITEIDPIPYELFFERFISVDRNDLPDIDLDFPDEKREIVFQYMAEKYGMDNVAHIGTVLKYKAKSALIHVCKQLNIPAAATAGVKSAMIERSSADERVSDCLLDTFNTTESGKEFIKMYPEAMISHFIEGHAFSSGTHAAGLLVCNDEITNYCVVDDNDIAHINKHGIEVVNLLKIDVLGLRTLSILEDSGVPIDWYNLKMGDPKTMEIFNTGKFCGIFQFEGESLRQLSNDLGSFNGISDISAITALARPGPFVAGVTQDFLERAKGKGWKKTHPLYDKITEETYGVPLYQEQTISAVRDIGNFTWEETYYIRKAISKTMGTEYINKFRERFLKGCRENNVDDDTGNRIFDMINAMGAWQMNKAHTYSYSVLSYWTAYLKAHHIMEFAAATLRSAKSDDSSLELLRELTNEGIEFVDFDINLSRENWSVIDGRLIGGFNCLKGIGDAKAKKLVSDRDSIGLSDKQIEFINKCERKFENIFPFHTNYSDYYNNYRSVGLASPAVNICDIKEGLPHGTSLVFLGELINKNKRDLNEDMLVKKRGGKRETRLLEMLDFRVRDDTGIIGCRIGRYDFEKIGRELTESIPIGTKIMIRAVFYNGIRYGFVKKWKVI